MGFFWLHGRMCSTTNWKNDVSGRSVQHVVSVDEIRWNPCPPNLPSGCEITVLEGSPQAADLFTARFRVDGAFVMPPHAHPKDERVTVLEGNISVAFGVDGTREDTKQFGPGDYYANARDAIHSVSADSFAIVQITGIGPCVAKFVD